MTRGATVLLVAAAVAVALAAFAPRQPRAYANGVPTMVQLSYLEGLSNWGPRDASGTLELSLGEGYAKVEAAGLPVLTGQRYQGWLVNSQSNDAVSIGTFNGTATGSTRYKGVLPTVPNFGFDLFIITVEPDPDDVPVPSSDRTLGGRFSLIGERAPDGTFSDPANPAGGAGPRQLPNTGDGSLDTDLLRVGVLLGAAAVAVAVATRLGRRHA